ncbi:hypothetical protein ABVN80_03610 [Acinetobacter baumannii]
MLTRCTNAWRAVIGRIHLMQGRFSFDEFADWLVYTRLNSVMHLNMLK